MSDSGVISNIVEIKNSTFGNNGYNCLEIGLQGDVLPKEITIENCQFTGTFSNNAISIFGTQNDALITIKNCTFANVSNVLRISNRSNAKNVKIIFDGCSVTKWETTPEYAGMILCQDYTSTAAKVDENCLFGNDENLVPKIAIAIKNCTGPNGPISFESEESVIGTKDASTQLLYVYRDKGSPKLLEYNDNNLLCFPMLVCGDLPDPIPSRIVATAEPVSGIPDNPPLIPGF